MDLLKEKPKQKNTKKIILTLLIISIVAVIITICLMLYISTRPQAKVAKKDKVFVDNTEVDYQASQVILKDEEGNYYLAVKDMTSLVGCNYFNGEYLKYSEDKTKCYVENIIEITGTKPEETKEVSYITGLTANSNIIYRANSESNLDYQYTEIQKDVIIYNEKLYISIEDTTMVLGAIAVYSEEDGLQIYTSKKLTEIYSENAKTNGYTSINIEGYNINTIGHEILIISKNNRYGITDVNFKEIVGTKYNTIEYNECASEFIVSNNSKYGIIDELGNIKVNLSYDEISIINYEPLLYKVKNDGKYGIMNEEGKLLTGVIYDNIGCKYVTEEEEENTVIVPQLDDDINMSIIVEQDSKYGLIDVETGEQILEDQFVDGIYKIMENGEEKYEAIFRNQKVNLKQYIKAVKTIIVNM